MSPYPQKPTFPIDVRGGQRVKVSRVGGTAIKVDLQDGSFDNGVLAPMSGLTVKSNLLSGAASPTDVSVSDFGASFGLGITRADIPLRIIPLTRFLLADGAPYVRGAANDFMAVKDAAGTWFKLDVSGGRLRLSWIGAVPNDASAATQSANVAQINAAMAALHPVCQGGFIEGAGYYYINGTLDNRYPRIFLQGPANDFFHDVGAAPFGLTFECTAPVTALRHRTPTAAEAGVPAAQNQKISGGGFRRLNVIGGARCLQVTSTAFGEYDLAAKNATGPENTLFDCLPDYRRPDISQMGEASDTQYPIIRLRLQQDGSPTTTAADCLVIDGFPGCGNTSYVFDAIVAARHANGVGLRVKNGDNVGFRSLRTTQVGGSGASFRIQAAVLANGFAGVNDGVEIYHYGSNAAGYVEGLADRVGATTPGQLTIWKIDAANNTPPPTAGAGAYLTIHEVNGLMFGLAMAQGVMGETLNSSFQGKTRRRATTSLHVINFSDDHICIDNGNHKWNVSINSANGDLRALCEVGSGVVVAPRLILSGMLSAASDAAAGTAGVRLNEFYLNTTSNSVRPRAS